MVNNPTPIITYKVFIVYSNKTVFFICSQFGVSKANRYTNIVIIGIEISSVKVTLLIFKKENLLSKAYFQPATSKALTAAALFSPNLFIEILSSMNVPHEATKGETSASFTTGYS